MFWARGKQEIEVVDFLIRMKECMVSEPTVSTPVAISPCIIVHTGNG